MTPKVTDAVRRWNELLAAYGAEKAHAALLDGMQRGMMMYKGRGICQVLRPLFVEADAHTLLLDRAKHVISAIHKVAEFMKANPAHLERVGFTKEERSLIAIDGGFHPHDTIGRLDSFTQPDGTPRFLEYNGESPGGIAFGDGLAELFMALPFFADFAREFTVGFKPAMPEVVGTFLAEYRGWAAQNGRPVKERPNVAIIDVPGVATIGEFHRFAALFESRGIPCRVLTTSEIRIENDRLVADGFVIDLVYRRLVTQDLLAALCLDHPIVSAMRRNVAFIANGFEGYLCSNKGLFAYVSDPALRPPSMTAIECEAVDRSISWTRFVSDVMTLPPDRPLGPAEPLIETIRRLKNRLVLKPTTGYGGQSVVLGWKQTDLQWEDALAAAIERPTVVQERVAIPSEVFPAIRNGSLESVELQYDVDPYILGGQRTYGIGVRLSDGELLNVAAGSGSAVPGFVIS